MIENVIGSLIAAVICKVVKKVSNEYSRVKQQIQNMKDEQQQKELQEKIEQAETEIERIQSDIIAETTRALVAPLEKVFTLNSIRAAFERASAISSRGATDKDVANINSELGEVYIRKGIRYLSKPLPRAQRRGGTADLVRDINSLTQNMKKDYELHDGNWYSEVRQILQWCRELEDMLIRYMEWKVGNASV